VPKDPRILPSLASVAPHPLSRAIVAEQEALTRQLRRVKDIEAEQALIEHHEHQALIADRRAAEFVEDAASHRQAAGEARARLAVLMRPAYSVSVDAPQAALVEPQAIETPTIEPEPVDRPAAVSAKPASQAPAKPARPGELKPPGPAIKSVLDYLETNPSQADGSAPQIRAQMVVASRRPGSVLSVPSESTIERALRYRAAPAPDAST
jgi:hypothetical protein